MMLSKRLLLSLLLVFCVFSVCFGSPVDTILDVVQPDGTTLSLRVIGDEYGHYYEKNGIEWSQWKDGWWKQGLDPSISTSTRFLEKSSFNAQWLENIYNGPKNMNVLLVKVDFEEYNGFTPERGMDIVDAEDIFEKVSFYLNREFGSYGQAHLNERGVLSVTYPKHPSLSGGNTTSIYKACRDIAKYVADLTEKDFNNVDTFNNYVTCNEMVVVLLIHSDGDFLSSPNSIWPHKWQVEVGSNGYALNYCAVSANTKDLKNPVHLGTLIHEVIHLFGIPDLYDIDYSTAGTGYWDVMGFGNYKINSDGFPMKPSPFVKIALGVEIPEIKDLTRTTVLTPGDIVKIPTTDPQVYFTAEVKNPNVESQLRTFGFKENESALLLMRVDEKQIETGNNNDLLPLVKIMDRSLSPKEKGSINQTFGPRWKSFGYWTNPDSSYQGYRTGIDFRVDVSGEDISVTGCDETTAPKDDESVQTSGNSGGGGCNTGTGSLGTSLFSLLLLVPVCFYKHKKTR